MNSNSEIISSKFLKVMNKILVLDKNNTLTIEKDTKIFPSEIHLILALGTKQATDFGALVTNLGVTKGAVSQTITRLEKKGILEKAKDSETNGLSISFTPLGKKAFKACLKIRETLIKQFSAYFSSISEDEMKVITKFISHLDETLDKY